MRNMRNLVKENKEPENDGESIKERKTTVCFMKKQLERESHKNGSRNGRKKRRCTNCSKPDHNETTCKKDKKLD